MKAIAALLTLLLLVQAVSVPKALADPYKQPVIMIDPGHGGVDGGTQNPEGTLLEKDLNLEIALRLAKRLRADGFRVVMTRETDVDVTNYAPPNMAGRHRRDLYGRVEMARRAGATLIVSVHGNHGTATSSGAIVFYSRVSPESYLLASELQMRLNAFTGRFHRPETGNFYVIRRPDVPSILLEYGYLSNSAEAQRLRDPRHQEQLVKTLTDGLYFFIYFYHLPR